MDDRFQPVNRPSFRLLRNARLTALLAALAALVAAPASASAHGKPGLGWKRAAGPPPYGDVRAGAAAHMPQHRAAGHVSWHAPASGGKLAAGDQAPAADAAPPVDPTPSADPTPPADSASPPEPAPGEAPPTEPAPTDPTPPDQPPPDPAPAEDLPPEAPPSPDPAPPEDPPSEAPPPADLEPPPADDERPAPRAPSRETPRSPARSAPVSPAPEPAPASSEAPAAALPAATPVPAPAGEPTPAPAARRERRRGRGDRGSARRARAFDAALERLGVSRAEPAAAPSLDGQSDACESPTAAVAPPPDAAGRDRRPAADPREQAVQDQPQVRGPPQPLEPHPTHAGASASAGVGVGGKVGADALCPGRADVAVAPCHVTRLVVVAERVHESRPATSLAARAPPSA